MWFRRGRRIPTVRIVSGSGRYRTRQAASGSGSHAAEAARRKILGDQRAADAMIGGSITVRRERSAPVPSRRQATDERRLKASCPVRLPLPTHRPATIGADGSSSPAGPPSPGIDTVSEVSTSAAPPGPLTAPACSTVSTTSPPCRVRAAAENSTIANRRLIGRRDVELQQLGRHLQRRAAPELRGDDDRSGRRFRCEAHVGASHGDAQPDEHGEDAGDTHWAWSPS